MTEKKKTKEEEMVEKLHREAVHKAAMDYAHHALSIADHLFNETHEYYLQVQEAKLDALVAAAKRKPVVTKVKKRPKGVAQKVRYQGGVSTLVVSEIHRRFTTASRRSTERFGYVYLPGTDNKMPVREVEPGEWIVVGTQELGRKAFWCALCKQCTASKVDDVQGWDGDCRNCGALAQREVLDEKP